MKHCSPGWESHSLQSSDALTVLASVQTVARVKISIA